MTNQLLKDKIDSIETEIHREPKFKRLLKFYLIPGWRDDQFAEQEYEIEKIKSKRRLFRRFLTPLTIIGLLLILFLAILAVYAPWLTTYKLQEVTLPYLPPGGDPFGPPSAVHPLGTTKYGYDILARIIWGARTTLIIATFPVVISIGIGTLIGTISAYFGGPIDYIIMRFVDLMYSIPMLIIVIILIPIMGQDLLTSLVLFGILYIPYNDTRRNDKVASNRTRTNYLLYDILASALCRIGVEFRSKRHPIKYPFSSITPMSINS